MAGCIGLIGVVLAGACRKAATPVDRGNREGVLLLGNGGDPPDLDPQFIQGVPENNIVQALFEGLVRLDPHDLHPVPGVAQSWDISPDGLTYTFHLRPEARWSNGDAVTAEDFYRSFQRLLNPALAAQSADQLYEYVVGAADYAKGRQPDFSAVGFQVVDAHTLIIRLNFPTPFFLQILSERYTFPVPFSVLARFGGPNQRSSAWTRPGNLVGNGPFILTEWKPEEVVTVAKSPTYWNRAAVRLQGVRFYPIENSSTEEAAFRTGQLHLTLTVPLDKLADYRRQSASTLRLAPLSAVYYYSFNTKRAPFNDVRVRRAFAIAIDRERLVTDVTHGGETPAYAFVYPGLGGYTSATTISRDLNLARQQLAEAGYPDGRGFPAVSVLYNTSDGHRAIAEALQQMWRKNLHVETQLYNQDWKVYLDSMHLMNYQIGRSGLVIDPYDPWLYLRVWVTGYGHNYTGWSNAEYDSLIAEAQAEPRLAARRALYQRAEAILLREVPILPIYFYAQHYLIRPEVRDWPDNLLQAQPLGEAWLQQ